MEGGREGEGVEGKGGRGGGREGEEEGVLEREGREEGQGKWGKRKRREWSRKGGRRTRIEKMMIRTRGRRENVETAKAVRGRTKEKRRVGRMRNIKHFTFFIRQVSAPVPSLNQRDQTYKKRTPPTSGKISFRFRLGGGRGTPPRASGDVRATATH